MTSRQYQPLDISRFDARYHTTLPPLRSPKDPYIASRVSPHQAHLQPVYVEQRYPSQGSYRQYETYIPPLHTHSRLITRGARHESPPAPPPHNIPRYGPPLPAPAPPPHTVAHTNHGTRSHEAVHQPDRYQQSRGAQRDAKWNAKNHERAQQIALGYGPPAPRQLHAIPKAVTGSSGRFPPPHTGPVLAQPSRAPVQGDQRRYVHPSQHDGYASDVDKVRAEQKAAIEQARRQHAAATRQAARKLEGEEAERKKRRIQLQVFVHARPTPCAWKGCSAVLNSWALLEKHLYHAHLHPPSRRDSHYEHDEILCCGWEGCDKVFARPEDCHKHCLVGHMGRFSARCPFDCRFEGPHFNDLMAHIARRHPNATPDDFVPGLIHHRPLRLPKTVKELPSLPEDVWITPKTLEDRSLCGIIPGCSTGVSHRVKRSVERNCHSGRRPRKDDFADKRGAYAAISAMIENSRRIFLALSHQQQDDDQKPLLVDEDTEGTGESTDVPPTRARSVPMTARSVPITAAEAKEMGVDLLDVGEEQDQATEVAIREVEADPGEGSTTLQSSRESSGHPSTVSNTGEMPSRPTLKLKLSRESSTLRVTSTSPSSHTSSDDSTVSEGSEFKLKRTADVAGLVSPDQADGGRKRSARLRLKLAADPVLETK